MVVTVKNQFGRKPLASDDGQIGTADLVIYSSDNLITLGPQVGALFVYYSPSRIIEISGVEGKFYPGTIQGTMNETESGLVTRRKDQKNLDVIVNAERHLAFITDLWALPGLKYSEGGVIEHINPDSVLHQVKFKATPDVTVRFNDVLSAHLATYTDPHTKKQGRGLAYTGIADSYGALWQEIRHD